MILETAKNWWTDEGDSFQNKFDPRNNSIGFLRAFLATAVIFSHSFPLGGNFGPEWGARFSNGQDTIGGIAVKGFFILSGFLIAGSFVRAKGTFNYLWRRAIRIMPGFWAALLVVAVLFVPLMSHAVGQGFGFNEVRADGGPVDYITRNLFLDIGQYSISGLTSSLPFPNAFNGSIWTLIYEAYAYIFIAVAGVLGLFRYGKGKGATALAIAVYLLFLVNLAVPGSAAGAVGLFSDIQLLILMTYFLVGVTIYVHQDKIIVNNKLFVGAVMLCLLGARYGFYSAIAPIALSYIIMYLSIHLLPKNFDNKADISYGIYIYGFPVQQLLTAYGVNDLGTLFIPLLLLV